MLCLDNSERFIRYKVYLITMTSATVTIPKSEYDALKKHKEIDEVLIKQLINSLEDVKQGRIEEWKD